MTLLRVYDRNVKSRNRQIVNLPQNQYANAHNCIGLKSADGSHVDELLEIEYCR